MFTPYVNGTESMVIDDLTIENQTDCVSVYGNLQLTKDQQGLAFAKVLQSVINAVVTELEASTLPERLERPDPDEIDNPFA